MRSGTTNELRRSPGADSGKTPDAQRLTVPPLRQRKDDIPLLVQVFTERYARELGKEITAIPKETMNALQAYNWPGNVRELENVVERAVILCSGPVLQLADKLQSSALSETIGLRTMEETERDQILKTLLETRWRINGKNGAAAILGLHPSTLRARMQSLEYAALKSKVRLNDFPRLRNCWGLPLINLTTRSREVSKMSGPFTLRHQANCRDTHLTRPFQSHCRCRHSGRPESRLTTLISLTRRRH
jgi:hypothetical protein